MYTLTPATMTRDYLAVADAAGADEFAWAGFSWGCVCGLQVALRTERIKALACGGFPTLDGIYDDMRLATKTQIEKPTSLYGMPPTSAPEMGRQFNTFLYGTGELQRPSHSGCPEDATTLVDRRPGSANPER